MRLTRVVASLLVASFSTAIFVQPAGAAGPPQMVKNINTSGSSDPQELTVMGGKLYFTARGGWRQGS